MNKEKQRTYTYYPKHKIYKKTRKNNDGSLREMLKTGQRIVEDPFTVSMDEVIGEFPSNHIEFIKRKKSYHDSTPIHFSHFILSHAKMKMLQFVDMLIDFWQTESLTLLYTGE